MEYQVDATKRTAGQIRDAKKGSLLRLAYGRKATGKGTFKPTGTIEITVESVRVSGTAKDPIYRLVGLDTQRRRVTVRAYSRYGTANIEIPD